MYLIRKLLITLVAILIVNISYGVLDEEALRISRNRMMNDVDKIIADIRKAGENIKNGRALDRIKSGLTGGQVDLIDRYVEMLSGSSAERAHAFRDVANATVDNFNRGGFREYILERGFKKINHEIANFAHTSSIHRNAKNALVELYTEPGPQQLRNAARKVLETKMDSNVLKAINEKLSIGKIDPSIRAELENFVKSSTYASCMI